MAANSRFEIQFGWLVGIFFNLFHNSLHFCTILRYFTDEFRNLCVYSIILNKIRENTWANISKTATVMPAPAIIEACWRMNSVVTFRHPFTWRVRGDGASMHGFRCPPQVSWQHDSGMLPYQSRYDSMPQHFKRVWVSSQASVIPRRFPYSGSVEYISCRIVCTTFSRNT